MALIRVAVDSDIPAMAVIRAREWQTEEYWNARISAYFDRRAFAAEGAVGTGGVRRRERCLVVGFVAGHLTRRHWSRAKLNLEK